MSLSISDWYLILGMWHPIVLYCESKLIPDNDPLKYKHEDQVTVFEQKIDMKQCHLSHFFS